MEYGSQAGIVLGMGGGGVGSYPIEKLSANTQKLGLEAHHSELRGAIVELSKRLQQLEARLGPILTPSMPTPDTNGASAPSPIRSSMLEATISARQQIVELQRHVESLIGRIEL